MNKNKVIATIIIVPLVVFSLAVAGVWGAAVMAGDEIASNT